MADVCPVPRDNATYASIAAAVRCAAPGDTLNIAPGVYYENIVVDKSLTIQGSGTASTLIDGGSAGRVFAVDNDITVTFADLAIQGGAFDNGGGIYTYAGNIVVERSLITGNQATGAGAGIYVQSGTAIVRDSTIANNAVLAYSNDDALADAFGSGVYVYSGNVKLENTIVSGNSAEAQTCGITPAQARGGGIYAYTGSVDMHGGMLSGNSVATSTCSPAIATTQEGAGLYTDAGTVTLEEVSIEDELKSLTDGLIQVNGDAFAATPVATEAPVENVEITENPPTADEPISTPVTVLPTFTPSLALPEATPVPTEVPADEPVVENSSSENKTVNAAQQSADVDAMFTVRWMQQMMTAVQTEKIAPPQASRIYACAGITLYQALQPGLDGYRSLVGQLNGLVALPQPEPGVAYDYLLVANAALSTLSDGLFGNASDSTRQGFATLRQTIENERGDVVPMNTFARSVALGESLGTAMLEWAHADNYDAASQLTYNLPTGSDYMWIPLEGQKPLAPYWGLLRPSVLPIASICDIEPQVEFSIDPQSAFYHQAEEVEQRGRNLSPEQRDIALFWADEAGKTATPPGHWISIVGEIVEQKHLSLGDAARAYALTSIAMGDAFIATWEVKYRVQLIRPISFIQRYIDPAWQPLISTPPFPEYPSGHSVSSSAAAVVLTGLFGNIAFTDNTHAARNLPARSFATFEDAAAEAAMSRLYGGIHYRDAIENGLKQGQCIGHSILDKLVTRAS